MCKKSYLKPLLILVIFLAVGLSGSRAAEPDDTLVGQVIVKMTPGTSKSDVARAVDGQVTDSLVSRNLYLLEISPEMSVSDAVSKLEKRQGVMSAEPNTYIGLPEINQISQSFPDQSRPVYLQGVEPNSFYAQPSAYNIGLDSAQLISTGKGVVVAVIDNGIYASHPLFAAALASGGYDFVDNDSDPSDEPGPMYGHGTFVSGLISLTAPGCKILPLRAFDTLGLGTTFGITRAIYAAIDEGAEVINMSFSMYTASTALRAAVKDARHAGIVMIASAGNDHTSDTTYPAGFPEVIAVSSIDESEQAAWFSNYGEYVDLCAPGVNLYSALAGDYEWGTWSGTSFSAALVSGACALELGYRTSLTPQQAGEDLIRSARTELAWGVVTPGDAIYYGSGCLDAYEALLGLARGDIDNSGWVDMSDLVGLAEYILDGGPPPVVSLRVADLNCDGVVNAVDLEVMKGLIARSKGLPKPCYLR